MVGWVGGWMDASIEVWKYVFVYASRKLLSETVYSLQHDQDYNVSFVYITSIVQLSRWALLQVCDILKPQRPSQGKRDVSGNYGLFYAQHLTAQLARGQYQHTQEQIVSESNGNFAQYQCAHLRCKWGFGVLSLQLYAYYSCSLVLNQKNYVMVGKKICSQVKTRSFIWIYKWLPMGQHFGSEQYMGIPQLRIMH